LLPCSAVFAGNPIEIMLKHDHADNAAKFLYHIDFHPHMESLATFILTIIFMFMYVLSYLGQLSHFPSCVGACVTNLHEPPSSFLLPPHYCGLGGVDWKCRTWNCRTWNWRTKWQGMEMQDMNLQYMTSY